MIRDRIICRCEDVHLVQIAACIEEGGSTVSLAEIKLQTRAGMGICQGRTCGPLLRAVAADSGRLDPESEALGRNQPFRPITLQDLAAAAGTLDPNRGVDIEADI